MKNATGVDTSKFPKKVDVYNAKIKNIEDIIHNIPTITATALTDIDDKYITTRDFNKLTTKRFTARLEQANLVRKNDISNFAKKADLDDQLKSLNKRVTSNKSNIY